MSVAVPTHPDESRCRCCGTLLSAAPDERGRCAACHLAARPRRQPPPPAARAAGTPSEPISDRDVAARMLPDLYVRRQELRERRAGLQAGLEREARSSRDRARLVGLLGFTLAVLALTQAPLSVALVVMPLLAGGGFVAARFFREAATRATEGARHDLSGVEREITDVDRRAVEAQRLATSA
jgi:hypothetical protein